MLQAAQLVGFVGVSDLDQAQQFYGQLLGLELTDERPFALVGRFGSAMLRLTAVERPAAAPYTVAGWSVVDIATTVAELTDRGVRFSTYPGMDQDELGIWTAPNGTKIAWLLDPDGNNLSLTQC